MAVSDVLQGTKGTPKLRTWGKPKTLKLLFILIVTCVAVNIIMQYEYVMTISITRTRESIMNNLLKGYIPGPYTKVEPEQMNRKNASAGVLVYEHDEKGFQNEQLKLKNASAGVLVYEQKGFQNGDNNTLEIDDKTIAIGGAITTRKVKELT
ncbi:unnamed protein product, partial [Owenia fusiformis]